MFKNHWDKTKLWEVKVTIKINVQSQKCEFIQNDQVLSFTEVIKNYDRKSKKKTYNLDILSGALVFGASI